MNYKKLLIASALIGVIFTCGCAKSSTEARDVLYQVDLLQSLTAGQYDGAISVEDFMKHGDIGIGTFEGVNGEMIVLDGKIYQALYDGSVVEAAPTETIPFATITYMDSDIARNDFASADFEDLKNQLNAIVQENSINHFYMVRIDGTCKSVTVRSESKQEKPYKPLDEALADCQMEYTYDNCDGTCCNYDLCFGKKDYELRGNDEMYSEGFCNDGSANDNINIGNRT